MDESLLCEQKERLLALMLAEEGFDCAVSSDVTRSVRTESAPLSFAQERLWIQDQMEPGNAAYNVSVAVRIAGPLNIVLLAHSLNEVVRSHEILRTSFPVVDGGPLQAITPYLNIDLMMRDLSGMPKSKAEETAAALAAGQAQRPFNLTERPPLAAALLRLSPQEYVAVLTMHHIITDRWSRSILIQEIVSTYRAFAAGRPSPLPKNRMQYADFSIWQRQQLQGEMLEKQLSYWKRQLAGAPVLQLESDFPRPQARMIRGAFTSFVLDESLLKALKVLSHRSSVSLFMTLLSAFQIVLSYSTGEEDIVVGTDVANRNRFDSERLIGFFVNQLVLRTSLSGDPTVLALLMRAREVCLEAYSHQDLPFNMLVEALKVKWDRSRTPLFQVKIVLQNTSMTALNLPGLALQLFQISTDHAKFDLLLNMWEIDEQLVGELEYRSDLFRAETVLRLSEHFETTLRHISRHPEARISDLKKVLAHRDEHREMKKIEVIKESNLQRLRSAKRKALGTNAEPRGNNGRQSI